MSSHAHPPAPAGATSDTIRQEARLHIRRRRAFSIHAGVYAASIAVIVAVNAVTNAAAGLTGEWWAWWSVPAVLGWGIGVTVHGLVVRLARPRSGSPDREEREIDRFLASEGVTTTR